MLYTSRQKDAIVKGKQKRNALIRATENAAKRAVEINDLRGSFKLDTILSGSTGIGKTYNMDKALQGSNVHHVKITGSQTFFQFATLLMLEHKIFQSTKEELGLEKLVVFVDDCDSFFSSKDDLNALKGMTGKEGSRVLQYNRAIQEHLMRPEMLTIIDEYRNPNGAQGFNVNCDDIIFVLTTNFNLPSENYANSYTKKHGPTGRANRLMDLAAVRRRFTCKDFVLEKETNWGWIAEVSLNDGLLDFLGGEPEASFKKYVVLEWMWNNWAQMTEHNLDTVKDLALHMHESPDSFKDIWEADYIDAEMATVA